jgi:hypothetical protein
MKNKYIMTDTTSIDQLPINPQISSNNTQPTQYNNIGNNLSQQQLQPSQQQSIPLPETQNIKIENYGQQLNTERSNDPMAQQIDYNAQLHSTLKEVALSGGTQLPSRDIPQNTLPIMQDQQTKPNFVPNETNDYIGDILSKEQVLKDNTKKQNQSDNLDYIYERLQVPVIVAILYFLFQLPAVRSKLLTFLPALFNKDGNPNFYGYVFNSIIFGSLYALLIKGIPLLKP